MKSNIYTIILTAGLSLIITDSSLKSQSIAGGGWHSLVICNDSTVKTFGENATGQLGDGTTTDRSNAVVVTGLTSIVAVSGGGDQLEAHSMALKRNGTVWAWGSNIYGGLGNGSTISTTSPVQVLSLTNVDAISAGGWHSVALKKDGTVWAWGWNTDGQLGDGTTTDRLVPVQVPGLSGIVKIAAGTYHVLALKSDGTVWAWGDNISGQIGDGTTTDRSSPVQVTGLNGITNIAAGRFFSLAVKNDGTVWTWGENLYGQLGDNTTADKSTPVQVSGLTGVINVAVATGAFHCLAEKNDNTVWAWGRNTYGNLGDNTTTHRYAPVQMTGVSSVASLAAGTNFSLLQKNDGSLWGCGRNASGQLGDGTVLQRNTVVQAASLCSIMQPVGIANQRSQHSEVNIFPNPSATGVFQINTELSQSSVHVLVINAAGQTVFQSIAEIQDGGDLTVDLSDQQAGIYFLKMNSGTLTLSKKLVRE